MDISGRQRRLIFTQLLNHLFLDQFLSGRQIRESHKIQQNVSSIGQIFLRKFSVASFNIEVFGRTKYGKTEVKDQIIEILTRYDIATIQVPFSVVNIQKG